MGKYKAFYTIFILVLLTKSLAAAPTFPDENISMERALAKANSGQAEVSPPGIPPAGLTSGSVKTEENEHLSPANVYQPSYASSVEGLVSAAMEAPAELNALLLLHLLPLGFARVIDDILFKMKKQKQLKTQQHVESRVIYVQNLKDKLEPGKKTKLLAIMPAVGNDTVPHISGVEDRIRQNGILNPEVYPVISQPATIIGKMLSGDKDLLLPPEKTSSNTKTNAGTDNVDDIVMADYISATKEATTEKNFNTDADNSVNKNIPSVIIVNTQGIHGGNMFEVGLLVGNNTESNPIADVSSQTENGDEDIVNETKFEMQGKTMTGVVIPPEDNTDVDADKNVVSATEDDIPETTLVPSIYVQEIQSGDIPPEDNIDVDSDKNVVNVTEDELPETTLVPSIYVQEIQSGDIPPEDNIDVDNDKNVVKATEKNIPETTLEPVIFMQEMGSVGDAILPGNDPDSKDSDEKIMDYVIDYESQNGTLGDVQNLTEGMQGKTLIDLPEVLPVESTGLQPGPQNEVVEEGVDTLRMAITQDTSTMSEKALSVDVNNQDNKTDSDDTNNVEGDTQSTIQIIVPNPKPSVIDGRLLADVKASFKIAGSSPNNLSNDTSAAGPSNHQSPEMLARGLNAAALIPKRSKNRNTPQINTRFSAAIPVPAGWLFGSLSLAAVKKELNNNDTANNNSATKLDASNESVIPAVNLQENELPGATNKTASKKGSSNLAAAAPKLISSPEFDATKMQNGSLVVNRIKQEILKLITVNGKPSCPKVDDIFDVIAKQHVRLGEAVAGQVKAADFIDLAKPIFEAVSQCSKGDVNEIVKLLNQPIYLNIPK